ncbi:uncharacterized protein LOC106707860 [Papilio machaon]|uniref:uncharacterized protein LOC106707860 n=1 Tax=Papilio machaon TaxID=76193 RepID=UPI001E663E32|nr:uncharacterized protein LOC106707860 [Papilio machaon]
MGLLALNMGRHQVALCVTLALFLQIFELHASECNKRTTFIQIRIPQKTNVAVKYPKEIDPVQFVPFPYNPSGSGCMKCQGTTCTKCVYTKSSQTTTNVHARKTNIIIDIKGTKRFNESIAEADSSNVDSSSAKVDGTIVGIYDKTSAASVSGATAKSSDNGNSSAAVASGTALSQSDILAAIDEEEINKIDGSKSHVEDVYVLSEDISTANANSTSASEGEVKNENDTSSALSKTDETQSSTTIIEKDSGNTVTVPADTASGVTTNDSSQPSSGNDSAPPVPDTSAIPESDASAVDKKPDNTGT